MMGTREDVKQLRIFNAWMRKHSGKPLPLRDRNQEKLREDAKKGVSIVPKHQSLKEVEEEIKRVNIAIKKAAQRNKTYEYPSEKEGGFLVEDKQQQYPYRKYAELYEKFLEKKVYGSFDPSKEPLKTQPKYEKQFTGEKSERKQSVSIDQTSPSTLEKAGYKVGSQGYPENVQAFEKEVAKQHPSTRPDYYDLEKERSLEDTKPDKFVFDYLNTLRKRFKLIGGEFSETTERWFKENPPDVVAIALYKDSVSQRRKERGRKMGLKSKSGGRPKKFHTLKERKEAKKMAQQKRTDKMRRKA